MSDATPRPGRDAVGLPGLLSRPEDYDYFQAVRLLEQSAGPTRTDIGEEDAGRPAVRIRCQSTLAFPDAQVAKLKAVAGDSPAELFVYAFGLTGVMGTLPRHYTDLVLQRSSAEHKDFAMAEFFDLFNDRAAALYHRAWEKYRFPFAYERAARAAARRSHGGRRAVAIDDFTHSLFALSGVASEAARRQSGLPTGALSLFAGVFARPVRTARGLDTILSALLGVAVTTREMLTRWLDLPEDQQTALTSTGNCVLGESAVAGRRAEEIGSLVRLVVRPRGLARFAALLPGGADHDVAAAAIRMYLPPGMDAELQLLLPSRLAPPLRLAAEEAVGGRLGRTAWLGTPPPGRDLDDAVIRLPGFPSLAARG